MIKLTQLLAFEIGPDCNLTERHIDKCPVSRMDRTGRPLTDDLIVKTVKDAYKLGFKGLVSWNFYNEPMLYCYRVFSLMEQIREIIPQSRFMLWTNGTILVKDPRFNMFESTYVSNYNKLTFEELSEYFTGLKINWAENPDDTLDNRLEHYTEHNRINCLMPFDSFTIDYTGNVHICCHDWRGEIKIGNVWDLSLEELDKVRQEYIKKISDWPMAEDAPYTCLHCNGKQGVSEFVKEIAAEMLKLLYEKGSLV
jgi:radical SAM protein with 4Fe4S-binding SPASM domain